VLLQFIIIFPLLYLAYKRYPRLTLIATFVISLLFELISPYISALNADAYIYYANILRYLFVITLGLWVLEAFEPTKRIRSNLESVIVLIGLVVGVIYMVAFGIFHWEVPFFNTFWGTEYPTLGSYVVIVAFYPLVLYMLAYRILPSNSENKIIKFIAYVGKASYHVFLVQILFFAVFYNPYATISQSGLFDPVTSGIISIVVSLAVTLPLGALFYKYEYVFDNILDRLFRIKKDDSDLTSGRSLKKQN
jgi:peptidoglycan/LPS O-acetylase OafA/YrhL